MEQQAKMKKEYSVVLKNNKAKVTKYGRFFLLLHKKLQTGWKKLKKLLEKLESGEVRLAGICLKI